MSVSTVYLTRVATNNRFGKQNVSLEISAKSPARRISKTF